MNTNFGGTLSRMQPVYLHAIPYWGIVQTVTTPMQHGAAIA
jgi:hypothetical protein